MRRSEKELTNIDEIEHIIESNIICRLGFVDGNKPYIVPVNYGYMGGCFYIHSALEGKKIDVIKDNNSVCVQIEDHIEVVKSEKACGFSTKYRSVICNGSVEFVTETPEKVEALNIIMHQHTGKGDWEIPEIAVKELIILKIYIDSFSGKISGL